MKTPHTTKAIRANWERMFKVLCFFQRAHGHCDVPANPRRDSLSRWLANQLAGHRAGQLRPERFRRLEALGVAFSEPTSAEDKFRMAQEAKWNQWFAALAKFKKQHGHCQVPRRSIKFHSLGVWLGNQRRLANTGRLRADRLRRLGELGMVRGRTDLRWNTRFAELKAFKKRFGHCDVPARWAGNKPLSHWVGIQRSWRRKGILRRDRKQCLEQIGFSWSASLPGDTLPASGHKLVSARDELWNFMFAALVKYKKQHGDCNVPPNVGKERRLYRWLGLQRHEARLGRLRADRRTRLDRIGFPWKAHNPQWDSWDKRLDQLRAFKRRFGHCDVPCYWPEDRVLGGWISNQRSFRRRGLLSQERIDRLDRIGFRWLARCPLDAPPLPFREQVKALDQIWEAKFAELVSFKKEHGHFRVPATDSRSLSLLRWANRQRENWRTGRLSKPHRRPLDKLGFPWKPRNPSWDLKFALLVAYKKRFGHCQVPARWPENMPLANWVENQRAFKRRGTLSRVRIGQLNRIGFTWGRGRGTRPPA